MSQGVIKSSRNTAPQPKTAQSADGAGPGQPLAAPAVPRREAAVTRAGPEMVLLVR